MPGPGWGDGMGKRWLPLAKLTEAPCLGAEKGMGVSCAFRAREQPPVILLYQLLVDRRWAAPLPCAHWSLPGESRSHPTSPLRGEQWGCPVSCAADRGSAHSLGRCSGIRAASICRGVSVSQLWWRWGVTLMAGICPLDSPGRRVP